MTLGNAFLRELGIWIRQLEIHCVHICHAQIDAEHHRTRADGKKVLLILARATLRTKIRIRYLRRSRIVYTSGAAPRTSQIRIETEPRRYCETVFCPWLDIEIIQRWRNVGRLCEWRFHSMQFVI